MIPFATAAQMQQFTANNAQSPGTPYLPEDAATAQQFIAEHRRPYGHSGNDIWSKLSDLFLGTDYQANYNERVAAGERAYEQEQIASARQFEEYLDSTKYQRMVKDLKAAGLNPWLAVQSGVSGSASGSTTSTGGNTGKVKQNSINDDKIAAGVLVALIAATAKIFGAGQKTVTHVLTKA